MVVVSSVSGTRPVSRQDNLGWGGRTRTYNRRLQRPLPYHLATPQDRFTITLPMPSPAPAAWDVSQTPGPSLPGDTCSSDRLSKMPPFSSPRGKLLETLGGGFAVREDAKNRRTAPRHARRQGPCSRKPLLETTDRRAEPHGRFFQIILKQVSEDFRQLHRSCGGTCQPSQEGAQRRACGGRRQRIREGIPDPKDLWGRQSLSRMAKNQAQERHPLNRLDFFTDAPNKSRLRIEEEWNIRPKGQSPLRESFRGHPIRYQLRQGPKNRGRIA